MGLSGDKIYLSWTRNYLQGYKKICIQPNLEALMLEDNEEISKVLFELSSNRRANILFETQKNSLKMQQLSKMLNMTVTETFRHLQRLSDSKLVEKKVDGTYAITSLGNLACGFLADFNFILKNTEFFLEHDLSVLPYEFVNRLGELSNAEFSSEPIQSFNRVRKILSNAEKQFYTMAEQVDSSTKQPSEDKIVEGLDFKFIMQQDLALAFAKSQAKVLAGSRYIPHVPVALVISEKEASVVFRTHRGVLDYLGLFGTDEKFLKWCTDLFLYYWQNAKSWYPNIKL
jgi:predicted transcriptional regulator